VSQEYHDLFDELRAYKQSRVLAVAFEVGLIDTVGCDGRSVGDIAAACAMSEDWVSSLLAVLANLALVEQAEARWVLTPRGKRAAADQALRTFAAYHLHCYEAWRDLPERCRGHTVGPGFHRLRARDPGFVRSYLLSMDAIAQHSMPFLKEWCGLTGNVLDIGAGPSTFCRCLAESGGCHVTALDLPPVVEEARKLFGLPANFEWVAADFRQYAPRRRFDALFCSHLLEYASASELPVWLTQMGRFLRAGGTGAFLAFLRGAGPRQAPGLDLFELSTGVNGEHLGHICTPDELVDVLKVAGASEIVCKALPEGPSYPEYLVTCTWA
jgi:SAM-dependent methyltransferase